MVLEVIAYTVRQENKIKGLQIRKHEIKLFAGEGNGTPLQYSCLESPMDGGAWWAAVHGIAESYTTERLHFHFSLLCIGEGNGNPLQCSCLENPRDGGAWWAAVHEVTQSRTRLKRLSSSSSKVVCICRWHVYLCRKSQRIYKSKTVPPNLELLSKFSKIAQYKINTQKLISHTVNEHVDTKIKNSLYFLKNKQV